MANKDWLVPCMNCGKSIRYDKEVKLYLDAQDHSFCSADDPNDSILHEAY